MKKKLVDAYYCDFCKKRGFSASHMSRHEKSCTNNPNRVCGMCRLADLEQKPMGDLLAAYLTDIGPLEQEFKDMPDMRMDLLEAWMEKCNSIKPVHLQEMSGGCPACMLAAIRQTVSDIRMDFNFAASRDAFMEELNRKRELQL